MKTRSLQKRSTKKGVLIVIDGGDGSGKATQTALLVDAIRKIRAAETIDFPRYKDNVMGGLIRECLDGKRGDFIGTDPKIASVLYAADRFETKPLIEKWLGEGKVVILDRYVSANQIHQGGKISQASVRKEFLSWLDDLEFRVFGLPRPDVIVYLHVPVTVSVALARARAQEKGQQPDLAEQNVKHQVKSQESALSIVKSANNWVKISCAPRNIMLSREAIHQKVFDAVQHLL